MPGTSAATVLGGWLRERGPAPAIVWYGPDQARVELSGVTAANAVAKAVNLFRDELLLDPGDTLWLDLPCHWQVPVLAVGAWAAGLQVAVGPVPPADAAATLGTGTGASAGVALAVSLHPWGLPLGGRTPPGWEDYAALARSQPDRAETLWPTDEEVWLRAADRPRSGAELLSRATELAAAWNLEPQGRLLSSSGTGGEVGLLAATVVPASVCGSVILATSGPEPWILRQEGNAAVAGDV